MDLVGQLSSACWPYFHAGIFFLQMYVLVINNHRVSVWCKTKCAHVWVLQRRSLNLVAENTVPKGVCFIFTIENRTLKNAMAPGQGMFLPDHVVCTGTKCFMLTHGDHRNTQPLANQRVLNVSWKTNVSQSSFFF